MNTFVEDYDDYAEGVNCPHCMGMGTENCYCGGDLCVCDNYGEKDCPVCYGEGEVSEHRHDDYLKKQAQWHASLRGGRA